MSHSLKTGTTDDSDVRLVAISLVIATVTCTTMAWLFLIGVSGWIYVSCTFALLLRPELVVLSDLLQHGQRC